MRDASTIAILVSVIAASFHLGQENNNSVESAAAMAHVAAASANRSSYSAYSSPPSNVQVSLENSKDTTDDLSTPNSIDINQPDMNIMNLAGTH